MTTSKQRRLIPYSRQHVTWLDSVLVAHSLRSRMLTQGPRVEKFSKALATYIGVPHVVLANSATSALILALRALGVGPGSTVWTTPNSFVATANAAVLLGAQVVFVDVEFESGNLSLEELKRSLESVDFDRSVTNVVIPVHFGGKSVDMRAVAELCASYDLRIVEDASHALGADYLGCKVGSSHWSDVSITSFHAVKMITTGEGGACFTRNQDLATLMRKLSSHGITSQNSEMLERPEEEIWNYQQFLAGYNFRLTDFQAALGQSQLRRLDRGIARRRAVAAFYTRNLPDGISGPDLETIASSSLHLYVVNLDSSFQRGAQKRLYNYLLERGVQANLHYIPIHLQPYYQELGFRRGSLPIAESRFVRTLSIPIHARLSVLHARRILRLIRAWMASESGGA